MRNFFKFKRNGKLAFSDFEQMFLASLDISLLGVTYNGQNQKNCFKIEFPVSKKPKYKNSENFENSVFYLMSPSLQGKQLGFFFNFFSNIWKKGN